jgi:hypothetical protein
MSASLSDIGEVTSPLSISRNTEVTERPNRKTDKKRLSSLAIVQAAWLLYNLADVKAFSISRYFCRRFVDCSSVGLLIVVRGVEVG